MPAMMHFTCRECRQRRPIMGGGLLFSRFTVTDGLVLEGICDDTPECRERARAEMAAELAQRPIPFQLTDLPFDDGMAR